MATPKPERVHDVKKYDIGTARQGRVAAIALRFHLRDGSTYTISLAPELATGMMLQIEEKLLGARTAWESHLCELLPGLWKTALGALDFTGGLGDEDGQALPAPPDSSSRGFSSTNPSDQTARQQLRLAGP